MYLDPWWRMKLEGKPKVPQEPGQQPSHDDVEDRDKSCNRHEEQDRSRNGQDDLPPGTSKTRGSSLSECPGGKIIKSRPVQSNIGLESNVILDLSSMLYWTWVQCHIGLKSNVTLDLSSLLDILIKVIATLNSSPMLHWTWLQSWKLELFNFSNTRSVKHWT